MLKVPAVAVDLSASSVSNYHLESKVSGRQETVLTLRHMLDLTICMGWIWDPNLAAVIQVCTVIWSLSFYLTVSSDNLYTNLFSSFEKCPFPDSSHISRFAAFESEAHCTLG